MGIIRGSRAGDLFPFSIIFILDFCELFRALHFRDCYPLLPFLLLDPPSRPIPHPPLPPLPFILRSVVDASRCPRGVGGRLVDRPPFNGRPRPRNDGVLRVTRCLRFRAPVFARGRNKASVRRRGELFLLHSVLSAWQELTVTTFCLATPAQFLELMTSLALISG